MNTEERRDHMTMISCREREAGSRELSEKIS